MIRTKHGREEAQVIRGVCTILRTTICMGGGCEHFTTTTSGVVAPSVELRVSVRRCSRAVVTYISHMFRAKAWFSLKIFPLKLSYRILRYMYGVLNIDKKKLIA